MEVVGQSSDVLNGGDPKVEIPMAEAMPTLQVEIPMSAAASNSDPSMGEEGI
jgi:hypothetical protein